MIEWQQKKGGSYKNSGVVVVNKAEVRRIATFIDYIRGGTEINATVAIDFTGAYQWVSKGNEVGVEVLL